jgi:hypothetical protein
MSDLFSFVLTPEQRDLIRQKQAERAKLEAIIADAQRRLTPINDWLDAIAKVTGGKIDLFVTSSVSSTGSAAMTESADSANMTITIEKIANESAAPVSRKDLKQMLAKLGYSEDRLGNYFYTVVHRLKMKGRITVQPDGSVYGAASKN